ncbi:MAG TPA: glycosyltransferase family 4 protein, partial [Pseudobdellovibrionaceae bacterium]|nr:glycosyltransferase family 4 protein [Pseudobdellovibrionaceae bacterium]
MDSPMRILHVLRSNAWGGLEHYALDLIQHLMQQGQQTSHVLLCRQGSRVATEAAIRRISTCHHRSAILESYDLIHVHQRQDLPMVRLLLLVSRRRPVVYSLYMSAPPKKDFYHRWIYGMIDSLMSSSQDLNQEVRMNFPLDQNRIHLVRYGRDTQKHPPHAEEIQEFRSRTLAQAGRLIFATLCRIDPGKGILDIIEGLKILSEDERKCFEIWIVGEPTLLTTNSDGTRVYESESIQAYEQLQEMSRDPQFQSCLKLIPYQKDPSLVLASIDVFLLATHKETYSLAVLDAFQMAKP